VNNKVCLALRHCSTITLLTQYIALQKIEIAVKQIISGVTLKPSGTVANPEAFKQYYQYVQLEKLVGETRRTTRAKL
jgi:acetoacetyl-CoA synthetase